MSDIFDRATEREQELRDDALAARERRARAGRAAVSAASCAVCEQPIPESRRQALPGVQTCVECQADLEHALQSKGY
ncbi:TraR/DksA C4-type zinc finger protein [Accumulibacter sp.]|uniref:TraR/DksA C4-type zinc finger protein n=1 Tax=Accumulibacter sp. TaxID=2053492 RepID=UPI0026376105|nr:TraR/DksA C4-type zinc finger protein [Accumulibacter sp.]